MKQFYGSVKMDKRNSSYKISGFPAVSLLILAMLLFAPSSAWSGPDINITVKTILASGKGNSVDPRLQGFVRELQSVFRYSSYDFLGEKDLRLSLNNKAAVSLPEQRTMNISARGIEGSRVVLEIEILKNSARIFQTVIKLRNNSSVTIGGPEYQGGNLLFNIFASF